MYFWQIKKKYDKQCLLYAIVEGFFRCCALERHVCLCYMHHCAHSYVGRVRNINNGDKFHCKKKKKKKKKMMQVADEKLLINMKQRYGGLVGRQEMEIWRPFKTKCVSDC